MRKEICVLFFHLSIQTYLVKIDKEHEKRLWLQKYRYLTIANCRFDFSKISSLKWVKRGPTRKSSIFQQSHTLENFDSLFFHAHSNVCQKLGCRPKFYILKLNPWRVMGITFLATPAMYEKIDEWFWVLVSILDFYQTWLIHICVIYHFVEQHLLYKTTLTTSLSEVSLCEKKPNITLFSYKNGTFF